MKKTLRTLLALCILTCMVFPAFALGEETVDYWGRYETPVTVRFAVNGAEEDGFTWEDNVWTQAWEEKFNIHTEILWNTGTDDAYKTKLSLAILSGDLPDYIITSNYNQFLDLVNSGYAQDITETYDQWIYPHLKENLEMTEDSQDTAFVDGKRYGICTTGVKGTNTRSIFIRTDYLEKVGADIPKTFEELVALGKKFVDEGLAKYALPLIGNITGEGYSDMQAAANAFGVYPTIWIDQDGKTVYGSMLPQMETVLNLYKDLYDNGYIDPTFATAINDTLTEQIMTGDIGILMGDFWVTTWPLPSLKAENGAIVDWTIIPLLPSETNDAFRIQGGANNGKMVVIRAGYEHPEAIMKLINHRCAVLDDPEFVVPDLQSTTNAAGEKVQNHMRCPIREYFNFPFTNMMASPHATLAVDTGDMSALERPNDEQNYQNIKDYLAAKEANDIEGMNKNWAMVKLFYGENSVFGSFYKNHMAGNYIYDVLNGYTTTNYERLWGTLR
ncbi:MAG: extracellular solute-binding protein, partial [Clostridia bacterium]